MLNRSECAKRVRDLLASDNPNDVKTVAKMASRFGVDATSTVRDWLTTRPYDADLWQWLVARANNADLPELFELAERLLPMDALCSGPADDLGLGRDYGPDRCLQAMLQRLGAVPGEGWPLVRAALQNRVISVRNMAIRVLSAWPRESWPNEVTEVLTSSMWREPKEDVRKRMFTLVHPGGART